MLIVLANWLLYIIKNENNIKKKTIFIYMLNLALYFLQDISLSKSTKKNNIFNINYQLPIFSTISITSTASTIFTASTTSDFHYFCYFH